MVSPPVAPDRRSRLCRAAWFDSRLASEMVPHAGFDAGFVFFSFRACIPAMPEFRADVIEKESAAAVIHGWWQRPIADPLAFRRTGDVLGKRAFGRSRAGCSPAGSTARWEVLPRGERVTSGLAIGPTTPLVLRGAAPTVGWAPVAFAAGPPDDTAMRPFGRTLQSS